MCEPSCPDCGAVDCDRAQSSNQQCSSSFHPGFQKVCNTCCRMECNCEAGADRERHNIWVEEMKADVECEPLRDFLDLLKE